MLVIKAEELVKTVEDEIKRIQDCDLIEPFGDLYFDGYIDGLKKALS